ELTTNVRTHKSEHESAIGAVVFQHALGQQRTIGRTSPDHSMDASDAGNRRIAWISTTNMRTTRCLQASLVIFLKHEGVVSLRVCAELWIIMERAQRERSAAA